MLTLQSRALTHTQLGRAMERTQLGRALEQNAMRRHLGTLGDAPRYP